MTTFEDAAREAAGRVWDFALPIEDQLVKMARWARDYLALQEPSDAEVLAALNAHLVSGSPRANPAPSLDGYYALENIDAMRAALRAASRAMTAFEERVDFIDTLSAQEPTLEEIEAMSSAVAGDAAKGLRAAEQAWRKKALTHIGQSARKGHKLHDVRTMHRRFGIYEPEDSCPDTSDEHRLEHHHEDSDNYGEFYCDEMLIEDVCSVCRDENGDRLAWPCPTVKILDKEN